MLHENSPFRRFQNIKETRAELTFAKTSGTVARDRENNYDPRNNCGTHFGTSPLLVSRMANKNYNRCKNFKSRPFFSVHANTDRKVEHSLANLSDIMDSVRNGTSGSDRSLRWEYFLFFWKSTPTKKSHVLNPGTRNIRNTLERHTRKIKQPGLGLAFLLVVCIFILPFVPVSGKFRGVPTCPGVLSFSTYHAKLPVSFSETYLRSIMSLWKCLYTFVTDSVPDLKKEEIQQAYLL